MLSGQSEHHHEATYKTLAYVPSPVITNHTSINTSITIAYLFL